MMLLPCHDPEGTNKLRSFTCSPQPQPCPWARSIFKPTPGPISVVGLVVFRFVFGMDFCPVSFCSFLSSLLCCLLGLGLLGDPFTRGAQHLWVTLSWWGYCLCWGHLWLPVLREQLARAALWCTHEPFPNGSLSSSAMLWKVFIKLVAWPKKLQL